MYQIVDLGTNKCRLILPFYSFFACIDTYVCLIPFNRNGNSCIAQTLIAIVLIKAESLYFHHILIVWFQIHYYDTRRITKNASYSKYDLNCGLLAKWFRYLQYTEYRFVPYIFTCLKSWSHKVLNTAGEKCTWLLVGANMTYGEQLLLFLDKLHTSHFVLIHTVYAVVALKKLLSETLYYKIFWNVVRTQF